MKICYGKFGHAFIMLMMSLLSEVLISCSTSSTHMVEKNEQIRIEDIQLAAGTPKRLQITETHLMAPFAADQTIRYYDTDARVKGQAMRIRGQFAKTATETSEVTLMYGPPESAVRIKLIPGSALSKQIADLLWQKDSALAPDFQQLQKLLRGTYSYKSPPM
jgi:hypothetical protein